MPFIFVSVDIQNGDLFVTSGIDGTYPAASSWPRRDGDREERAPGCSLAITAKPQAGVDNHRFVRILTAKRPEPPPPPSAGDDRRPPAREKSLGKARARP